MTNLLAVDMRLVVCRVTPPCVGERWTWRAVNTRTGETIESPDLRTSKGEVMAFLAEGFPMASVSIEDPWAA